MKRLTDYHYLYLKCDALLLAVFEKLRNNSLKKYRLCQSHYLCAPGWSWDAMFKMTQINVALIVYSDMYIFFEKGMRGGTYYISNRYSKCLKSYNPKQDSKHYILRREQFTWLGNV